MNNSFTAHTNKINSPVCLENYSKLFKFFDNRVKVILYCRRHGTSNIYNRLKDLPFVIVDIIKNNLPRREVGDRQVNKNYKYLHLESELEYGLLSVVFKYINNPERIILRKRPKKLNKRRRRAWKRKTDRG